MKSCHGNSWSLICMFGSLSQGGERIMDPCQIRATDVCSTPACSKLHRPRGHCYVCVSAVSSDRKGLAQVPTTPGPQQQGPDQHCPVHRRSTLPYTASHCPARCLSAGGCGHDTAASLGKPLVWTNYFLSFPSTGSTLLGAAE